MQEKEAMYNIAIKTDKTILLRNYFSILVYCLFSPNVLLTWLYEPGKLPAMLTSQLGLLGVWLYTAYLLAFWGNYYLRYMDLLVWITGLDNVWSSQWHCMPLTGLPELGEQKSVNTPAANQFYPQQELLGIMPITHHGWDNNYIHMIQLYV